MKRYIVFVLCLIALCSMSGCGDEETVSLSAAGLADRLFEGLTFEDSLDEVISDTAFRLYGIDSGDVAECVVYISTGATSEELAVFEAASESSASVISEKLTERRDAQIKTFLEYKSSEMGRLDNAVIYKNDLFVAYVVSDDSDRARDIISGCMKQK